MTRERSKNNGTRMTRSDANGGVTPDSRRHDEDARTSKQEQQAGDDWEVMEQELTAALEQWDVRIEPQLPPLAAFEQLVGEQRARSRSRLWRDLLVFWAVAALVLSMLVLVAESSVLGFVILQATVFVAAIAFVALGIRSKEEAGEWRS